MNLNFNYQLQAHSGRHCEISLHCKEQKNLTFYFSKLIFHTFVKNVLISTRMIFAFAFKFFCCFEDWPWDSHASSGPNEQVNLLLSASIFTLIHTDSRK